MRNAQRLGYTFEVLNGYKFKKEFIFKSYVETLYKLRNQYNKTDPLNLICKLLLNSLYGKFGMKPEFTRVEVFDSNDKSAELKMKKMFDDYGETIQDHFRIDNFVIAILIRL